MSRLGAVVRFAALAVAVLFVWQFIDAGSASASGQRRFGSHVDIDDSNLPGLLAGGAEVAIKGHSIGKVVIFGADVQLDAAMDAGLDVVAGSVRVSGPTKGGAQLIGGQVRCDAPIEGGLTATASRIDIGANSKIAGAVNLTGAKVSFAGDAADPLSIVANDVEFNGHARGSLHMEGAHVHIGHEAVIDGDPEIFTYGQPEIDPGAKIAGHVNLRPLSETRAALADVMPDLFLLGSAMMAGLMFLWLGRGGAEGAIDELIDGPASSALWGLAAVVLLPIAALVLSLTIIGAPVGFLAILAMPLLLLLGYACAGLGLGEWFFNRLGEPRSAGLRALHLLAGLVCLGALGLIPWAGPVFLAIATLCGLGALLRTLHDRMRSTSVA